MTTSSASSGPSKSRSTRTSPSTGARGSAVPHCSVANGVLMPWSCPFRVTRTAPQSTLRVTWEGRSQGADPLSRHLSQPHTLHYLSHDFPDLLDVLAKTPHARISSVLTAADAFSLAHPATTGDSSAAPQVRELELHFGTRGAFDETKGSAPTVVSLAQRIERGREELARRTRSRFTARSGAAHLLRVVQTDMILQGENGAQVSAMDRRGRVVLEGGLLASVFLGRYVSGVARPGLLLTSSRSSGHECSALGILTGRLAGTPLSTPPTPARLAFSTPCAVSGTGICSGSSARAAPRIRPRRLPARSSGRCWERSSLTAGSR